MIKKTIYYYILVFASILVSFSFIPLIFEIIQQKITSNIPYFSLYLLLIAYIIYCFVCIIKQYYFHLFIYTVGLLSVSLLIYLKMKYDNNNKIEILKYNENS
jgi:uncharacterized protein with PQ loop repeat